jgi:hypothetical protein
MESSVNILMLKRGLGIAVIVGPILIVINQIDAVMGNDPFKPLQTVLTFLTPLCVSIVTGLLNAASTRTPPMTLARFPTPSQWHEDFYKQLTELIATSRVGDIKDYYRRIHGMSPDAKLPNCAGWSANYSSMAVHHCRFTKDCTTLANALTASILTEHNGVLKRAFGRII